MSYLVFRKYGEPILALEGEPLSSADIHAAQNGFGTAYDSGVVVASIESTLPDIVPQCLIVSLDAEATRLAPFTQEFLLEKLYSHEKRINVLESKPEAGFPEFRREFLLLQTGRITVRRAVKITEGTVALSGGGDIFILGYRWYLPES